MRKIMHSYPLFSKKVDTGTGFVLYVWNVHQRRRFAVEHGPEELNCDFSTWDVEDFRFESRSNLRSCGVWPV
jgi:hypothetical protein